MAAKLVYGCLWMVAVLPMALLHRFSTLAAWVLRKVVRYRRTMVRSNLQACFPHASQQQLSLWEKQSYLQLTDLIVEMIKGVRMSGTSLDRRMVMKDEATVKRHLQQYEGKGGIVMASHYGNFEWTAFRLDRWFQAQGIPTSVIYAQLSDQTLDTVMRRIRSRWGAHLIPKRHALLHTVRAIRERHMAGFVTDQSPVRNAVSYDVPFLGQKTRWLPGAARLAARIDGPVFFADVKRSERGYYELSLIPLSTGAGDSSSEQDPGRKLMEEYVALLETRVQADPGFWLWSHNRWK